MEAASGFEPENNGFANRRLGPLGYAASDAVMIQRANYGVKVLGRVRRFDTSPNVVYIYHKGPLRAALRLGS